MLLQLGKRFLLYSSGCFLLLSLLERSGTDFSESLPRTYKHDCINQHYNTAKYEADSVALCACQKTDDGSSDERTDIDHGVLCGECLIELCFIGEKKTGKRVRLRLKESCTYGYQTDHQCNTCQAVCTSTDKVAERHQSHTDRNQILCTEKTV